jgi:hypothetical protein
MNLAPRDQRGGPSALNAIRAVTDNIVPHNPAEQFETRHFVVSVDPATGAIIRMRNRTSGREWASEQKPIALFTYRTGTKPSRNATRVRPRSQQVVIANRCTTIFNGKRSQHFFASLKYAYRSEIISGFE